MNQTFKQKAIVAAITAAVAFGAAGVSTQAMANQFASSNTATPTLVYLSGSATTNKKTINDVVIQELGTGGINDGFFTVRVPSNVKVNKVAGAAQYTRDTTFWGTAASPRSLRVTGAATANATAEALAATIYVDVAADDNSGTGQDLFNIVATDTGANALDGFYFGPTTGTAASAKAAFAGLADWTTLALVTTNNAKVGQVYLDTTTNELVFTFAIATSSSVAEKIVLSGLSLSPTAAGTTGTATLKIENSAVTSHTQQTALTTTTVDVLSLSANSIAAVGTASGSNPPVVQTGALAPQYSGQIKITAIGDTASAANTLKLTLNNGAKWVSNVGDILGGAGDVITHSAAGVIQTFLRNGTTPYTLNAARTELTITLDSVPTAWLDGQFLTIPASVGVSTALLDTSAVTTAGDITVTVTGGVDFASATGSVVVAKAAATGVTTSFLDDATAGYTTLFTGRKTTLTGEGVTLTEAAFGSLKQYGTVALALSSGAKFQNAATPVTAGLHTGSTTLALTAFSTPTTATATLETTVSAPTTVTQGAEAVDLSAFKLDLTGATAGDLNVTLSGSAGATGVQKVAEIKNATTASTGGAVSTAVVGSVFTVPDIVITESAKGAIPVTDQIVVVLPEGSTIQTGTATLADAVATGAVTGVTVKAVKASDGTDVTATYFGATPTITAQAATTGVGTLAIAVAAASSSTAIAGPVVITVSGLKFKPVSTQTNDINAYVTSVPTANIGDAVSAIIAADGTAGTGGATGASLTKLAVGAVVASDKPSYPKATVADQTKAVITGLPLVASGNDQGKAGAVYVAVIFQGNVFFLGANGTWVQFTTAASVPAYATGTLGTTVLNVLPAAIDLTPIKGAQLVAGYGIGIAGLSSPFDDFIKNARYNVVYEVK